MDYLGMHFSFTGDGKVRVTMPAYIDEVQADPGKKPVYRQACFPTKTTQKWLNLSRYSDSPLNFTSGTRK
jgi:hypothetical protein